MEGWGWSSRAVCVNGSLLSEEGGQHLRGAEMKEKENSCPNAVMCVCVPAQGNREVSPVTPLWPRSPRFPYPPIPQPGRAAPGSALDLAGLMNLLPVPGLERILRG